MTTARNDGPGKGRGIALITMARWRVLFWLALLAVLVMSLMPTGVPMPSTGWDKSNHLLGFACLAVLGSWGYPGRPWRLAAGLLAYGALVEVLQSFTPHRYAEWADLLADGLGIAIGMLLVWLLARLASARPRQSAFDEQKRERP